MCECCCVPVAIPATCVLPASSVVVAAHTFEVSGREMGGDGFQTQKCKSWIPGKDRAEKVLAKGVDLQVLFQDHCLDALAMKTMLGCGRSIDRQCRQRLGGGRQDHRHRAVEKKSSPEIRMRKLRNCERRLNSSEGSREWRRGKEHKVIRREESGTWRMMRRRSTIGRSGRKSCW